MSRQVVRYRFDSTFLRVVSVCQAMMPCLFKLIYEQGEKLRLERPATGFDSKLSLGTNSVYFPIELSPEKFSIH